MVKKQMSSFNKSLLFLLILIILPINTIDSNSEETFDSWLTSYKKFVLRNGVSTETIDLVFKNVKYLEQVIVYDRKQPEFFEDTITYVSKRANQARTIQAKKLLDENSNLFISVENEFSVEKEILL